MMNVGTHFRCDKHLANIGTHTRIGTVICALLTSGLAVFLGESWGQPMMNVGTHFRCDKYLANIGTHTRIGTVICALLTRPEQWR